MASHVSALKRARQIKKRTAINRANKSRVRRSLRDFREALAKGEPAEVEAQYRLTTSALDRGVQKGILHDNTASRYKSRLRSRMKATAAPKA